MSTDHQELRRTIVDVSGRDPGEKPEFALLARALPALNELVPVLVETYGQLHERYANEGPSQELSGEALSAANDLGAVLQALTRNHALVIAVGQRLNQVTPPFPLWNHLHNNLILLTGEDRDTLDVAISPAELREQFETKEVRKWFKTVDQRFGAR